jgi:hypothetical protein
MAEILRQNILKYVSEWKPAPSRTAVYAGDGDGRRYFESAGVAVGSYDQKTISTHQVLIVGPGGGRELAPARADLDRWLKGGGHMLAIGFDQRDADGLFAGRVGITNGEHIAAYFSPGQMGSMIMGVAPADVHNRDPREIPLVAAGLTRVGDGVLGVAREGNVVFCQLAPWQFDAGKQSNLKRTFRRSAFLVSRLLGNMGVSVTTPILDRFKTPVDPSKAEKRWLAGLYLDQPEEWDDPYRFFRW